MQADAGRAARPDRIDALSAALLVVLGTSLGMVTFSSGKWGARPSTEDEFVYLFQAKSLAAGHLSYPSPPLPEFFEAAHVLVVPRFAAKYFPGHAAVLALFELAGAPWLGPCVLLGATAALLHLAARLAGLTRAAALGPAAAGGRRAPFRNGVQGDDRGVDDAALVAIREPVHALRRARHRTRSRPARRARVPGAPDGLVRGISRNAPEAHLVAPAGGDGPPAAADRRASAGMGRHPFRDRRRFLAAAVGHLPVRGRVLRRIAHLPRGRSDLPSRAEGGPHERAPASLGIRALGARLRMAATTARARIHPLPQTLGRQRRPDLQRARPRARRSGARHRQGRAQRRAPALLLRTARVRAGPAHAARGADSLTKRSSNTAPRASARFRAEMFPPNRSMV